MKHSILFSVVGSVLFFGNVVSADTIEVAIANRTNESCLFWSPSKTQFSTLINNVQKIVKHENYSDTGESGRLERNDFLSYLKDWRANPDERFNIILNGLGYNDLSFYRNLPELIKYSDAGDLFMLQSLLIAKIWPMDAAHETGNYVPIWSEKKIEAFYAQHQPPKPREEPAPRVTAVPDSTNNNVWGF